MRSLYRKLFEVEIRHDYFLLPGPGEMFPADYDVSRFLAITPSDRTLQIMKDRRMVLRVNKKGFTVFVHAEFINTATGYAAVVDFDPNIVLSFYWRLNDRHFINFTNQRLTETVRGVYYFSNRGASQQGGVTYLNKAIHAFGTTYLGEPLYRLGDLVSEGGETYEMIDKETPPVNFPGNASSWQKINTSVVNYVNPDDRLRWQSPRFRHERANSHPAEFINYKLFDVDNQPVDLGLIPGTDKPQNEYRAPANGFEPVNHSIDMSHLEPGRYSLEIVDLNAAAAQSFYLMDPLNMPGFFGVSEFFASGAALPFQFIREDAGLQRWVLDDPPKVFVIRFRNRLTRWKYLNQNQTVFHQPAAPRPLTKSYSGYQILVPGGTLNLPDPDVDNILPEIETPSRLVKNIYSHVFLTK